MGHSGLNADQYAHLNTSFAASNGNDCWTVRPNGSVITLKTDPTVNSSGQDMLCYAWHSVPGYSAFGSYVGTQNTDGPFVYTGFRPAFVMVKGGTSATNWSIYDSSRHINNGPPALALRANETQQESAYPLDVNNGGIDLLSNGFKIRTNDTQPNLSGTTYIYMAFAEHPFGGSNVSPAPAR
jgi:hypothetical protein